MQLSNIRCRTAKPLDKPYKLTDGGGLYLEIVPSGKKYWRWQYRFAGKRPRLSFGHYPEVSLVEARQRRDECRSLLREGIDPARKRRQDKLRQAVEAGNTFEVIGREWHTNLLGGWAPRTASGILYRLEKDVFPFLGKIPITEIEAPDVLAVIRRIEKRGATYLSRASLQYTGRIFRYAIATGRASNDPTYRLFEALKPHKTAHLAALEAAELPEFLETLRGNQARLFRSTVLAVEFLMLTFVRTVEMIGARWDEFDLEDKRWLIPAARMKMKKDHIVPLSTRAVEILNELSDLSVGRQYVFPHKSDPRKHLSDNTILRAIERLGYRGRMTGHGFRALAMSTIKERLGYRHEVIDRQLAHQPRSKVDKAYDRAQFLDERRVMMQDWSDYIDEAVRKHREQR